MSDGDRIDTSRSQLQVADALIDAADLSAGADVTTNGAQVLTGLQLLGVTNTDQARKSEPGMVAGRRRYPSRQVVAPLLADDDAALAHVLQEVYPVNPSVRRDLVFSGFGWPTGNKYRLGVRTADGGHVEYDRPAAAGSVWAPVVQFDAADPAVYSFDPQSTITIGTGTTHAITGAGNFPSHRWTATFWGPWTSPGIYSSVVPGGGVEFPLLDLLADQGIFVQFDPFDASPGLGSFELSQATLYTNAMGFSDPSYPEPNFFPILPGAQTLHTTGSGSGHVDVVAHDAWITPAVS